MQVHVYCVHGNMCAGELERLQACLWQQAFPQCDDLNFDPKRDISAFSPHLSLGQFQDEQQLLAYKQVGDPVLPQDVCCAPGRA